MTQLQTFNSFLVYGLYSKTKLIYIGHTSNLIRRIQKHKKYKKFNEYKILHETKNLRLSLYYERKLIRTNQPPLNKTYNSTFNYEVALRYLKLNKINKKSKLAKKYTIKSISNTEFSIFKDTESYAWKITKIEIKKDEKYLKQILNIIKSYSSLNIKSITQKIITHFEERLPTDTYRLGMWIHCVLKIYREEENNIKNTNIIIQKQIQENNRVENEKLIIKQQKERESEIFDSLDVLELGITRPSIKEN